MKRRTVLQHGSVVLALGLHASSVPYAREAMRLANSCTVMVSGRITSRTVLADDTMPPVSG